MFISVLGIKANRLRQFVLVGVLLAALPAITVHAQSGRRGTIVNADTLVFVIPNPTRTPLISLDVGTVVRVLNAENEWLQIEFPDQLFGPRLGYVRREHVKVETPQRVRVEESQVAGPTITMPDDDGTPTTTTTTCSQLNCVPATDFMKATPPRLTNPRASERVR